MRDRLKWIYAQSFITRPGSSPRISRVLNNPNSHALNNWSGWLMIPSVVAKQSEVGLIQLRSPECQVSTWMQLRTGNLLPAISESPIKVSSPP